MSRIETIGDCTLILGDCRDILPTLGKADAVLTDPPYGIGENGAKSARPPKTEKWVNPKGIDYGVNTWDNKPIDKDLIDLVISKGHWQIIFGGNYYALPATSCWLVWDKINGENDFADCELAWTNLPKAVRRIRFLWNGFQRANNETRGNHPTQKPIGVMTWCINHFPASCETILDPFMGSGTTGVACVNLGRKFIGIEREEKYFDIACKRIATAYSQPRLFEEPRPKAIQDGFDL